MQGELEQVCTPCAVHDGQGADHQYALDAALLEQVVRCPDDAARLARALLVEAERTAVQGEECSGVLLVVEGLVLPGPVVVPQDG